MLKWSGPSGRDRFLCEVRPACRHDVPRGNRGLDGRQYVAVSTGTQRFIDLTPELQPSCGNSLFVCAALVNAGLATSPSVCRTLRGGGISQCIMVSIVRDSVLDREVVT